MNIKMREVLDILSDIEDVAVCDLTPEVLSLTISSLEQNVLRGMDAILFGSAGGPSLDAALAGALTPAAALAFLVMQMLFIPCVATVAAIRQETRSWAWTPTASTSPARWCGASASGCRRTPTRRTS